MKCFSLVAADKGADGEVAAVFLEELRMPNGTTIYPPPKKKAQSWLRRSEHVYSPKKGLTCSNFELLLDVIGAVNWRSDDSGRLDEKKGDIFGCDGCGRNGQLRFISTDWRLHRKGQTSWRGREVISFEGTSWLIAQTTLAGHHGGRTGNLFIKPKSSWHIHLFEFGRLIYLGIGTLGDLLGPEFVENTVVDRRWFKSNHFHGSQLQSHFQSHRIGTLPNAGYFDSRLQPYFRHIGYAALFSLDNSFT